MSTAQIFFVTDYHKWIIKREQSVYIYEQQLGCYAQVRLLRLGCAVDKGLLVQQTPQIIKPPSTQEITQQSFICWAL